MFDHTSGSLKPPFYLQCHGLLDVCPVLHGLCSALFLSAKPCVLRAWLVLIMKSPTFSPTGHTLFLLWLSSQLFYLLTLPKLTVPHSQDSCQLPPIPYVDDNAGGVLRVPRTEVQARVKLPCLLFSSVVLIFPRNTMLRWRYWLCYLVLQTSTILWQWMILKSSWNL